MSDYRVTDTQLTAIADAIRTKTGGSATLEFPTEFVSEIGNISGSGGATILSGASEPSASDGSDGNVYLKCVTSTGETLPSGTTRLLYIGSGSNQYINTGYVPTDNTSVTMECKIENSGGSFATPFGSRASSANQCFLIFGRYNSNPNAYYAYGNRTDVSIGNATTQYGDLITLSLSNSSAVFGDLSASFSGSGLNGAKSIYLFGLNENGSPVSACYCNMKLYRFKIYESNVLVRDYVPILDSNNVACLYDLINEGYLYNSGSGSFSSEIYPEGEITNAYLKVSGTWQDLIGSNISDVTT